MKAQQNSHSRRRAARLRIVQALYRWQLYFHLQPDIDPNLVMRDYLASESDSNASTESHEDEEAVLPTPFDEAYFKRLWEGIIAQSDRIDAEITSVIDRPIESLTPIEYAVLRLGTYELLYEPDIPWRVVIYEALEVTRYYGAVDGYKYVNAVLDRLSRVLRKDTEKDNAPPPSQ